MIVKKNEILIDADDPTPTTPEDACLHGAPSAFQEHFGISGQNKRTWLGPMSMTRSAQALAASALFG